MLNTLKQNPILKLEQARIRGKQPPLYRIRALLIFSLLFVGTLPLWIYMDESRETILAALLFFNFGLQGIVWFITATIVNATVQRLRFLSGKSDLLMLTGIHARTYVFGVWWTVIRRVWIYYVLIVIPRIGFAYGLAQFLHAEEDKAVILPKLGLIFPLYHPNFLHISYNLPQYGGIFMPLNPNLDTVIIATAVLFTFALFEIAFFTAFSLLTVHLMKLSVSLRNPIAVVGRGIIVLAAAYLMNVSTQLNGSLANEKWCCVDHSCRCVLGSATPESLEAHMKLRILETLQGTVSAFNNQGILLATNIMRPYGEDSGFGKAWMSVMRTGKETPYYEYVMLQDSNLPFAIRNLLSAVLAFVIYGSVTWGIMRFTQFMAYLRGFGRA